MYPRHISRVEKPVTRVKGKDGSQQEIKGAIAPYNFVELPNKVVAAEPLPSGDRYHFDRYTGKVECTLTTQSPLYIRSGLISSDFASEKSTNLEDLETCSADERIRRTDFFKYPGQLLPVIPGSSLRGMLRTLIEIASFSKLDRVSNNQKFFFRTVAGNSNTDSVAKEYKDRVNPQIVQAGYLKTDGKDWYIHPAKSIKGVKFSWVRESSLDLPNFKKFDNPLYCPQYIDVSYSAVNVDNSDQAKRIFAEDVGEPIAYPKHQGVLVTSGNMKLANGDSPRRNHCLVFEIDSDATRLKIDEVAIQDYCDALTDFQKKLPFSEKTGVLKENRPVFYSSPKQGVVGFFGQSPNFRISYSLHKNGHASTVLDFLPEASRDPSVTDIADAIFGFVRQQKQDKAKLQTRAGCVFIGDAKYKADEGEVWERVITPQILGSPKPTTFQHYLVQPEETGADKAKLKHYASQQLAPNSAGETTSSESIIRGHKLYWHKGNVSINKIQQIDRQEIDKKKTQYTEIKPIKKGVSFEFTIHVENLTVVELGALLWILTVAKDEKYRLSLGMGKPLGMGAVKITHTLSLSDRPQHYRQLFDNQNWHNPTLKSTLDFVQAFEDYMLNAEHGISEADHPKQGRASKLEDIPRIKMLLAMLSWDDAPPVEKTRYMEIERTKRPQVGNDKNEYKERPVLPTPLDILGWEDYRRIGFPKADSPAGQSKNNVSSDPARPRGNTLSERQVKPRKAAKESGLQEGAIVAAEIVKISGREVTVAIAAQTLKKKNRRVSQRQVGDPVRIRIELLEDGAIKKFEFLEEE